MCMCVEFAPKVVNGWLVTVGKFENISLWGNDERCYYR